MQTSGNDFIRGFASRADTFDGGAGDDTTTGFSGSDTYLFNNGDGNDLIVDAALAADTDRLVFGSGLTAADILFTRTAADLDDITIAFSGAAGSVKLDEQFVNSAGSGIEQIVFGDQQVWSEIDLKLAYITSLQTSGDDAIYGFEGTNDIFDGGAGNDTISGLSGSDTYIFGGGDGDDTIVEGGQTAYIDRLVLDAGLLRSNISIVRSPTDLDDVTLSFTGYSGSVRLDEQLVSSGYGIDEIVFGDGTTGPGRG